ncbi:MAG: hypothetical protein ACK5H2_13250 [Beutenbergiaceae bacterium]
MSAWQLLICSAAFLPSFNSLPVAAAGHIAQPEQLELLQLQ